MALSKTESPNMRELIARVLNALCRHADLRGKVVQQVERASKEPFNPLFGIANSSLAFLREAQRCWLPWPWRATRRGSDRPPTAWPGSGSRRTRQSHFRDRGYEEDRFRFQTLSTWNFSSQLSVLSRQSVDVIRPICQLLNVECSGIENFEALMALGNLASLGESTRKRILNEKDFVMQVENYMFEEHRLIRRAAVQCFTNLCSSELQVERCEGKNDKVKYVVLLCGDDEDAEVVKAAAGALAMLTSRSNKICQKVFDVRKKGRNSFFGACFGKAFAAKFVAFFFLSEHSVDGLPAEPVGQHRPGDRPAGLRGGAQPDVLRAVGGGAPG